MAEGSKFSVNKFRESFVNGVADTSLFEFKLIGLPKSLFKDWDSKVLSELVIHTRHAQFPDMSIQTNPFSYAGIPSKYPYENAVGDMNTEVMCSGNYWERRFFADWQNSIIDYGNPSVHGSTFLVGYHRDYVTNAQIDLYDSSGKIIQTVELWDVWPIQVSPMDLDWTSNNIVPSFFVTFTYSYWSIKGSKSTYKGGTQTQTASTPAAAKTTTKASPAGHAVQTPIVGKGGGFGGGGATGSW